MNKLMSVDTMSMTSLEIAELVESRHDSVKRTIERLANQGVIEFPPLVEIPTATKPTAVYQFTGEQGRRDSIVVVAQLSPEFAARLVDRWQELEKQVSPPTMNPANLSRIQLIQLAMEAEQEKLALEATVKEQAPLVDFARQVEISKDAISVAQAAKILGTGQQRLFSFLRQIGWITRRNEPYQSKIEAGYLDVKLESWEHPNHGLSQSVTTLVTGKGLSYIQKHIQEQRMEGNSETCQATEVAWWVFW